MAGTIPRRLRWKAGATITAVAMAAAGAAIGLSGAAGAADIPCYNPTTGAFTSAPSCSTTGTATVTTGTLSMVAPLALTWGDITTLAGTSAQTLYDTTNTPAVKTDGEATTPAVQDEALYVLDTRGLAPTDALSGWQMTATATQFTGALSGIKIPDSTSGAC